MPVRWPVIKFDPSRADPMVLIEWHGYCMRSLQFALVVRAIWIILSFSLFASLPSIAAAQGESRVGTWQLDLAKSTFNPGPPPQRQTLTYQAAGPQWTSLLQGVDAWGKPINPDVNNLVINFDGREHSTPAIDYDTTVWQRIDEAKYRVIRRKAGKVVLTSINVLSADGKRMTITTTGHNAAGQMINNVRVYEKQ